MNCILKQKSTIAFTFTQREGVGWYKIYFNNEKYKHIKENGCKNILSICFICKV